MLSYRVSEIYSDSIAILALADVVPLLRSIFSISSTASRWNPDGTTIVLFFLPHVCPGYPTEDELERYILRNTLHLGLRLDNQDRTVARRSGR